MRGLRWIAMVGAGILLGSLFNVYPISRAAPPAAAWDAAVDAPQETVTQLREINAQLKELRALLCSGKVRVIVVINPEAEEK